MTRPLGLSFIALCVFTYLSSTALAQEELVPIFPTLCRGDSKGAPELTSKEQQQLKSLHQEMAESWQSLQQAGKNWRDYQHQLAVDRFPTKVDNQVVVSSPWANGLAFTPDFRFAVPRTH
jgi:hypothetical protein